MESAGEIEVFNASGGKVTDSAKMRAEFFELLREAERRRAKADLFYLAKVVLGGKYFNDGISRMDYHHEEVCQDLMALCRARMDRSVTRHAIQWPRGTLKSTINVEALVVWILLNWPEARILIDSEIVMNSYRSLMAIKAHFESEGFQYLFGQLYDPMNRWNTEQLRVNRRMEFKEPSVDVGGVDTEKTGMHYDFIICTDVQGKTNSETRDQIEKVLNHMKHYGSLLNPGGCIFADMTRWAHGDAGGWMEEQNAAAHKAGRPAPWIINKLSCFKKDSKGRLTDELEFPTILTMDKLAEERSSQGAYNFSCNYLLDPTSEESSPFKAHWIKDNYHNKSLSDFPEPRQVYIAIDPAGEGTYEDADYTAICVALIDSKSDIYVLDMVRGHFNIKEIADRVLYLSDLYRPKRVGIESVFAQKKIYFYLKEQARIEGKVLHIEEFKTSNKIKDARIMGLQPLFEIGKIHIKPQFTYLEDELLRYPRGHHDDCPDALAYILEFAEIPMARQPKEFWQQRGWGLNDQKKVMTDAEFQEMHGIQKPDKATLKFWDWDKKKGKKRKMIYMPTKRNAA